MPTKLLCVASQVYEDSEPEVEDEEVQEELESKFEEYQSKLMAGLDPHC